MWRPQDDLLSGDLPTPASRWNSATSWREMLLSAEQHGETERDAESGTPGLVPRLHHSNSESSDQPWNICGLLFTQLYRGQYTLSFKGALQVTGERKHIKCSVHSIWWLLFFVSTSLLSPHNYSVSLNTPDSKWNETLIPLSSRPTTQADSLQSVVRALLGRALLGGESPVGWATVGRLWVGLLLQCCWDQAHLFSVIVFVLTLYRMSRKPPTWARQHHNSVAFLEVLHPCQNKQYAQTGEERGAEIYQSPASWVKPTAHAEVEMLTVGPQDSPFNFSYCWLGPNSPFFPRPLL